MWRQSHRQGIVHTPWKAQGARGTIPCSSRSSLLTQPPSSVLLSTQATPRVLVFNPDFLGNGFCSRTPYVTLAVRPAETWPPTAFSATSLLGNGTARKQKSLQGNEARDVGLPGDTGDNTGTATLQGWGWTSSLAAATNVVHAQHGASHS